MKKRLSFVSIPSPVSSDGQVHKKDMRLPSLINSDQFSLTEISQEILNRHPQNTFVSLLEWTEAWELAVIQKKELCFVHSNKEIEVIQLITKLKPKKPSDLLVLKQIAESQFLPSQVKYVSRIQYDKYKR